MYFIKSKIIVNFKMLKKLVYLINRFIRGSIRTINTTGAAKGILRLPHRWQRVVHNAGDYIEGQ